jgi:hypothetical protein
VIVFGCAITSPGIFERCARPGFELAAEPDTEVIEFPATGSIFHSYNRIIEQAARRDGLEALVLVHQDAEIVDPDFCHKLRRGLAVPDVGIVGCVGAVGVRSIAWWEGSATWGSFTHRYQELGGGEFPGFSFHDDELPPHARIGQVDMVDGFVLGLTPWTIQNVRFDESLGVALHGYDFDLCCQVRAAGHRVVTEDLKVVHHHSLELISDPESYVDAHMRVAEKWQGRIPFVGEASGDWESRTRRAEAEAAAARAQALTASFEADARERQYEEQLREVRESLSWRLTAPGRRLASLARAARRGDDVR